jgi:hypothetical protein
MPGLKLAGEYWGVFEHGTVWIITNDTGRHSERQSQFCHSETLLTPQMVTRLDASLSRTA